jgi:predicted phosphoribosyltransferase
VLLAAWEVVPVADTGALALAPAEELARAKEREWVVVAVPVAAMEAIQRGKE